MAGEPGVSALSPLLLPSRLLGQLAAKMEREYLFRLDRDQDSDLGAMIAASFSREGWPVAPAVDGKRENGQTVMPRFGREHHAIFEFKLKLGDPGGTSLVVKLDRQHGVRDNAWALINTPAFLFNR